MLWPTSGADCDTTASTQRWFGSPGPEEIPAEKWRDYDPDRRARAHCLRRKL
jgi:hypothetical protein